MYRRLILVLLAFIFSTLSVNASNKPNLVLLPIDVSEQDAELEAEYGSALQEGLQQRYTVFYGAAVEKQLEKEYSKIDCDAETCNQNLAIAFNGELIADGAVKATSGGYLLKLVIRNVITGEVVDTKTQTCRDCDSLNVIDRLRALGSTGIAGADVDYSISSNANNTTGQRAVLIFDSQPSGATVMLNGKNIGKTPYQGLTHKVGEKLELNLEYPNYEVTTLNLQLQQAITQLQPIQLKQGMGKLLIASEPYKADAQILVNGESKGIAPAEITLPAGEYEIQIAAGKQRTHIKKVRVAVGDNTPLKLSFLLNQKGRETIRIGGVGFDFITIPEGSYMMGNDDSDNRNEKPAHKVNVESFRMMTHELTWNQYQPCIDAGACPDEEDYGWGKGNRPVIGVNYNTIVNHYIPWLEDQIDLDFRLPTEAEWEYAARAGSTTKYSWGDNINCTNANYLGCETDRKRKSKPVGSYSPNAFGLYDMYGNVWEWTQDCWNNSYQDAPSDERAWEKGDCTRAVIRGGSFENKPKYLRSSFRGRKNRALAHASSGFRLIQEESGFW